MRVLMLCKACVVGTYQRKLEEIARHADVELRVLVPPHWQDAARGALVLERAYTEGYELRETPVRFNGNFHLHHFPRLGNELREFRPQIVHIDEEPYNVATWHALWHARRSGARTLFFSWQNIARRYPPPFCWGEKWVLRHVDYALMGTQSAADVWRAKGYSGPLAVVPQFGVDPQIFAPPKTPRAPDVPTVGFVGRLVEEKGGADLLRALAQVHVPWQLAVVGEGPHKPALQALAAQLGLGERVRFMALPSTQMPDFYRRIDVLAVPSRTRPNWKEQFGRVLIEAMACGVPVIGSDSGAIPDVIGGAGLIFAEGDVAALAAHLQTLLTQPARRQELGRHGRQRVLAHFTQQQVAAQTVAVYRKLLGTGEQKRTRPTPSE